MASAAPIPRAAPVTTAVRPSSLNSPPLSVAKHYSPHPERCGLCYMPINCIRLERMCPEQIDTTLGAKSGEIVGCVGRWDCLLDHPFGSGSEPRPKVDGAPPYLVTSLCRCRRLCRWTGLLCSRRLPPGIGRRGRPRAVCRNGRGGPACGASPGLLQEYWRPCRSR